MPLISRMLGIWALGKTVSSTTPLFMRLLLGMAVITLLTVFCAVVLAMVLAVLVWMAYGQLLGLGVPQTAAVGIIGLCLLAMALAVISVLQYQWQKANRMAKRIMYMQAPISGRISIITDAFMSGFNTK